MELCQAPGQFIYLLFTNQMLLSYIIDIFDYVWNVTILNNIILLLNILLILF